MESNMNNWELLNKTKDDLDKLSTQIKKKLKEEINQLNTQVTGFMVEVDLHDKRVYIGTPTHHDYLVITFNEGIRYINNEVKKHSDLILIIDVIQRNMFDKRVA